MSLVFNIVQNTLLLEPGDDEALGVIIRCLFLAGGAGVTSCLTISHCGIATKSLSNALIMPF